MTLWSVSGSDVANCGWNTAVGCGVLAVCATTAFVVKRVAALALAQSQKTLQERKYYSSIAGDIVGWGVAFAAFVFVPYSRFALISDDSIIKILVFQVVQVVIGFIIGKIIGDECHAAATVGAWGATAGSPLFGRLVILVLGIMGADVGSGVLAY